jgi:hypothetical protein
MYTTTEIIHDDENVLEDDKLCNSIPDEKLFAISDSLISQNIEAYKELAQ